MSKDLSIRLCVVQILFIVISFAKALMRDAADLIFSVSIHYYSILCAKKYFFLNQHANDN